MGNRKLNEVFEARIPFYYERPTPSQSHGNVKAEETKTAEALRADFIHQKYLRRAFESGKLGLQDACTERFPQALFAFVFKAKKGTGKKLKQMTKRSTKWFVLINNKIQIFPSENALGAPSQIFDVLDTDIR